MAKTQRPLWWVVVTLAVLAVPTFLFREGLYRALAFPVSVQGEWWARVARPVASLGFWLLILILAVLVAGTWKRLGWRREVAVAPAPFLAWTINWIIKSLVRETRPCFAYDFPSMISCPVSDWSWPSGHSAIAGAVATACVLIAPRIWPLAMSIAFILGYLRVAMGVHYVHDVLCGWLVGIAFTMIWYNVLLRLLTNPPKGQHLAATS